MTSPSSIVEEIEKLRGLISRDRHTPELLSQYLERLAFLFSDVGDLLVEARDNERTKETETKYYFAKHKLGHMKEGDSATLAESKARLDLKNQYESLDKLVHATDLLKLKREDVEKILDATRSRLSLIKGDIQRG